MRGDADKLEQILDNLLTNAIKFTLSGTIRFHTEYMAGRLYVEVGDTGIGMDEETLERVFRPFERAAQEINSEGFGLGLFITKALVKVLDGSIEVESRPGKGTTFRLSFPLSETTGEPETEELPVQSATILPKHVLVVDDDSILLKITEDMLGRNGVECTTCQNAKEAILALDRLDYDLVLTDIQMPVTDGFGLLRLLRNSDIGNSRTVPVAVMTARGDGDSGVYMKSGFAVAYKAFLFKRTAGLYLLRYGGQKCRHVSVRLFPPDGKYGRPSSYVRSCRKRVRKGSCRTGGGFKRKRSGSHAEDRTSDGSGLGVVRGQRCTVRLSEAPA